MAVVTDALMVCLTCFLVAEVVSESDIRTVLSWEVEIASASDELSLISTIISVTHVMVCFGGFFSFFIDP